jgi:monomeric isocitrate dehydrogenase
MPVVVRDSGKMWNKEDVLEDVKCMIPDRCYAKVYKTVLDDCREHGQFDVSTMGKLHLWALRDNAGHSSVVVKLLHLISTQSLL